MTRYGRGELMGFFMAAGEEAGGFGTELGADAADDEDVVEDVVVEDVEPDTAVERKRGTADA